MQKSWRSGYPEPTFAETFGAFAMSYVWVMTGWWLCNAQAFQTYRAASTRSLKARFSVVSGSAVSGSSFTDGERKRAGGKSAKLTLAKG